MRELSRRQFVGIMSIDERLRKSVKELGAIVPVIATEDGKIIDGRHRIAISRKWPVVTIKAKDPLKIARIKWDIHDVRRDFDEDAKSEIINEAAEILKQKGVKTGDISKKLSQVFPLSEVTIRAYLKPEYKMKTAPILEEEMERKGFEHEPPSKTDAIIRGEIRRGRPPKTFIWECPSCQTAYEFFGTIKGFKRVEGGK